MKKLTAILIFGLLCNMVYSQEQFGKNVVVTQKVEQVPEYVHQKLDIGFGFGLDYGGLIGAKICYSPIKHLGIFASVGYHLISVGWQTGIAGYVLPRTTKRVFRPYLKVMYGSNRVIEIEGASQYNGIYYGFTPGIGVEFRFGRIKKHGLNIDLNYPIGSEKFKKDYDYIKHHTSIQITSYSPVTISLGYHFVLF